MQMMGISLHLAIVGPGGPEILLVMLVLLMLFGAKDAPRMFRKMSDMLSQLRRTADNFKREVMYSDLNKDPSPDESMGEYDDFGLADADTLASDESHPETDEPGNRQEGSDDTAGMEGEGDDVPKN